jgi:hypothetical protein
MGDGPEPALIPEDWWDFTPFPERLDAFFAAEKARSAKRKGARDTSSR